MACIEPVEMAVSETLSIGLTYKAPDLATGETIMATSSVAATPSGLTLSAVTISGATITTFVTPTIAGVEYVVLFKTVTSGGNTYNNPNRDALLVRVI